MSDNADKSQPIAYVVDDDASIREAVEDFLSSKKIRSESYEDAESFLEHWDPEQTGCLLLDARLPGMSGVKLQERIAELGQIIPIVFMTAHGDIPMVRRVMKAGAIEFLTKPFDADELLAAIRQGFQIDATRRAGTLVPSDMKTRWSRLSPREREVMRMVVSGMLNKQIAAELGVSEISVKLHRRHVMDKMKADSLAELIRMASQLQSV